MYESLLNVVKIYYCEIIKNLCDNIGIPVLSKGNKTLYISKSSNGLVFLTKDSVIEKGVNEVFEDKDVVVAVGMLNQYIDDISRKTSFFNSIMYMLNCFYEKAL